MSDKLFYTDVDRRAWVNEPTFVRWRAKYRGPRESLRINQEMTSFELDIHLLFDRMQTLMENLDAKLTTLSNGDTLSTVTSSGGSVLSIIGTDQFSKRVAQLADRIKALEGD